MRTAAAALAALALTLSVSPRARAESAWADKGVWARSMTNRMSGEVDVLSRKGYLDQYGQIARALVSVVSLGGQVALAEGAYVEAWLPLVLGQAPMLTHGQSTRDTRSVFLVGNLTAGGHLARKLLPELVVYAGASMSLPLTWGANARELEVADVALLTRAFFDTHRTFLNHLPLRLRGGAEMQFKEIVELRTDLAASLALSLGSDSTELVVEQGNELQLGYQGFGAGLRVQEAFLLTEPDMAQVALEPFVNWDMSTFELFTRVGILIPIDEPMGFGLGEHGMTTLRINSGMKF
ncbi:hypothetical protein [Sorangium sp. So ce307]|uniref:hypothetical protein n=1 Tax=Sorangium sp. So ce307 TaxID=3133298 RepID=UPI003F647DE2